MKARKESRRKDTMLKMRGRETKVKETEWNGVEEERIKEKSGLNEKRCGGIKRGK